MAPTTRSRTNALKRSIEAVDDDDKQDKNVASTLQAQDETTRSTKRAKVSPAASTKAKPTQRASTKKATPATRKPKRFSHPGNQGQLSVLPSMSLDVLFEILGHLTPRDLIQLSRTNKAFRAWLLASDSLVLWRRVLELQPGTPPCPEDISPIAWAHLMYNDACTTCGRNTPFQRILFIYRKRLCAKCNNTELIKWSQVRSYVPNRYLKCRKINIQDLLEALPIITSEFLGKKCPPRCDKAIFDRFWLELDDACKESHIAKSNHDGISEVYAQLVQQKKAALEPLKAHALLGQEWLENEERSLRDERIREIIRRLGDMGYTLADCQEAEILQHPEVDQAKPLTERMWTLLRPKILGPVEEARKERLEAEAEARREGHLDAVEQAFGKLWNRFNPQEVPLLPTREQLLEFDIVAQLLEQPVPTADTMDEYSTTVNMTAESVFELTKKTLLDYKKILRAELLKDTPFPTIPSQIAEEQRMAMDVDDDDDLSLLDLAVSFFHPRRPPNYYKPVCDANQALLDMTRGKFFEKPNAFWSRTAGETARKILKQLGLPLTTTAAELDQTNVRVVCTMCRVNNHWDSTINKSVRGRQIMNWRTAMDHVCEHNSSTKQGRVSLQVLSQETLAGIDAFAREKALNEEDQWGCLHCEPCGPEFVWRDHSDMAAHAKDKHGILDRDLKQGVDFFHNPNFDCATWGRIAYPMEQ